MKTRRKVSLDQKWGRSSSLLHSRWLRILLPPLPPFQQLLVWWWWQRSRKRKAAYILNSSRHCADSYKKVQELSRYILHGPLTQYKENIQCIRKKETDVVWKKCGINRNHSKRKFGTAFRLSAKPSRRVFLTQDGFTTLLLCVVACVTVLVLRFLLHTLVLASICVT
jgi:hypothetical protein